MDRWTSGTDGQVEKQTDKRWTNEETDRQRDGQTNRWADKRQTEIAQETES